MPIAEGPMETGPNAGAGPGGPEDDDMDRPPQRGDAATLPEGDGGPIGSMDSSEGDLAEAGGDEPDEDDAL